LSIRGHLLNPHKLRPRKATLLFGFLDEETQKCVGLKGEVFYGMTWIMYTKTPVKTCIFKKNIYNFKIMQEYLNIMTEL
jgi:hypothetical protein